MVKPRAGMVVCDEDCAVSPGGSVEVRTHGGAIEPDWALTDPSFWTPNVDAMIRPAIGLRFKTMNEGVEFYMSYGRAGGFDVRHSTMKRGRDGEVTMRYLVCSRQGTKGGGSSGPSTVNGEGGHVKQRRKRISNRVQCLAKICLRQDNTREFVVTIFEENHTHPLCSEASKQFLRINRNLDATQQAFIASCIKANIGTAQSFRLCKELVGTYGNIGATSVDFHNFKRDLQEYVSGGDGEMIIKQFSQKREVSDGFYFDYQLDEENRLTRLFWADPLARDNFSTFGDAISFDATYGTNRYSLVFVPFTGVDNHRRCITLGAGLLTKEDVDSYMWLLDRFKTAMGKSPLYVVTDQDAAMIIAVERVLPESRHRFCMWHIMTKVSEKAGGELAKDEVFRKKLNSIVWSDRIVVEEFESQWQGLMAEYDLGEHRWFNKLYAERMFWISAYFLDLPMSGLLRTTSRSEGENSAYGKFTNPHSSIVEFYMQFEGVLEAQRHKQTKLNAQCEGYSPEFKTPLALERHVAQIYTITIFYEVQKEILGGCFFCRVVSICEDKGLMVYVIKDEWNRVCSVEYNPIDFSAQCSCKLFQRMGLVCRHMFLVFKEAHLQSVPPQYVVGRWCKQCSVPGSLEQCSTSSPPGMVMNLLWAEINTCVGMVGRNEGRLTRLLQAMNELKAEFVADGSSTRMVKGNTAAIQALCGVCPPQSISIKPPAQVKNKGSGKRIKSKRELAIEAREKGEHKCGACGLYGRHDRQNCPKFPRVGSGDKLNKKNSA
ncbi:protein FAR1-RELATED SEQUENCE 5-like [Ipomoea triloba]|uniref:protein FAR1-RELATED SEQUENCE 5-like n=1 Tax=Ipomoea triloba TaxID=35885 RepID=UPI00125E0DDC|nr:protein FAR1-RELATED SEQUENCE 5-like [Ipomoea triloba]